jgi:D-alanyl-D-alanine dipeptidase
MMRLILLVVMLLLVVSISDAARQSSALATIPTSDTLLNLKPKPAPARWRALIGEYVLDNETVIILEKEGKLSALFKRTELEPLREVSVGVFEFASKTRSGDTLVFSRDRRGRVTQLKIGKVIYERKPLGPEEGATQLKVEPLRPVPTLIQEALKAQPPNETGDFLPSDLVELKKLDRSIKLDVRYATTNNLFGTVFYSQPRAFMQRAPAEALVRINQKLKKSGYGLLVHDGYRPWYVTKVFWDATPDDKKLFVADPSKGSRHNRGAAVDLTLYDLKTGKPVEMVSTYDETTDRAYPDYPGGTSLQRWHRDLLRAAMEADGFKVFEAEWWHFDFNGWERYRIGNERFERIGTKPVAQRGTTDNQRPSFLNRNHTSRHCGY